MHAWLLRKIACGAWCKEKYFQYFTVSVAVRYRCTQLSLSSGSFCLKPGPMVEQGTAAW